MTLSTKAKKVVDQITSDTTKLGDIKKLAKDIKTDHELAQELWSTGTHHPRLLATLIFDKKRLDQAAIDQLADDLLTHGDSERQQITDWLLANQLMKSAPLVRLIQTWEKHPSPILRRLFWYHQARLRWTGQTPPGNSEALMASLEADMAQAEPDVQWAMNYCAGQIGIHEAEYRARCVKLGETTGLYKDEPVARNCTPSYLPEFIRIEVAKRQ